MSGVWTAARIRQEMDRLAEWRNRLAESLALCATQLDESGLVPQEAILFSMHDYRERLRSLSGQITRQPLEADARLTLDLMEEHFQQS